MITILSILCLCLFPTVQAVDDFDELLIRDDLIVCTTPEIRRTFPYIEELSPNDIIEVWTDGELTD